MSDTKPEIMNTDPVEVSQESRRAVLVVQNVAINALLFVALGIYLAITTRSWQAYQFIILSTQVVVIGFVSAALIRRGRSKAGAWLIFASDLIAPIWASLLVSDLGFVAVAYILVTAYFIISNVMPKETQRVTVLLAAIGVIISILAELLDPAWRLVSQVMLVISPIFTGILGLIFIWVIARQAWARSVRNKMLVSFIGVTVLAAGALAVFVFTSTTNLLRTGLERELDEFASEIGVRIGDLFNEQISTLTTLAINEGVLEDVALANTAYSGDAESIQAELDAKDMTWRAADAADDNSNSLVAYRLSNPIAQQLNAFQDAFPNNIEIFITDVYGGLVGTTNRTSDYFQADEEWWQAAYYDGDGAVYIGQPEFDESANALGVQIALPIRDRETREIIGILRTTYLASALTDILDESVGQTGKTDLYIPGEESFRFHGGQLEAIEWEEITDIQSLVGLGMVEMEYDGEPSVVVRAPLRTLEGNPAVDSLGWIVLFHQTQDEAFAPLNAQIRGVLAVVAIVIIAAAAVAFGIAVVLVRPIIQLTETAEEVAAGDLNSRAAVNSDDEYGILAQTFNQMTGQLQETLLGLEERVLERTRALETSTDVGRRLSTILDQDELVREVVQQVQNAFDYYHAHIYLFDNAKDNLVMVGGTGEAGRTMLESGHQIARGQGLVGSAGDTNLAILVPDVSKEEDWLANPLLPETRAEVAVPIAFGDEVVGVLDGQDDEVGGLSEAATDLLQSIANQVAVALRNTQAYRDAQQQAQRETQLGEISGRIQETSNVEDALKVAVRELSLALDKDAFVRLAAEQE